MIAKNPKKSAISKKDIASAVTNLHPDADIVLFIQNKYYKGVTMGHKENLEVLTLFLTEYIERRTANMKWFFYHQNVLKMAGNILTKNKWSTHTLITPNDLELWFDEELRQIVDKLKASA